MQTDFAFRSYDPTSCATFRKTAERFGGLSNMAAGFPLLVNGIAIRTSEALYQACRFPHRPELQAEIIHQASPMAAKMVGKPYAGDSRPDWDEVRVPIMAWTLRVKLIQNFVSFGDLLLSTSDLPIIENSRRDDFWGAIPQPDGTLRGRNVLGCLLMALRRELVETPDNVLEAGPPVADMSLMGEEIRVICLLDA